MNGWQPPGPNEMPHERRRAEDERNGVQPASDEPEIALRLGIEDEEGGPLPDRCDDTPDVVRPAPHIGQVNFHEIGTAGNGKYIPDSRASRLATGSADEARTRKRRTLDIVYAPPRDASLCRVRCDERADRRLETLHHCPHLVTRLSPQGAVNLVIPSARRPAAEPFDAQGELAADRIRRVVTAIQIDDAHAGCTNARKFPAPSGEEDVGRCQAHRDPPPEQRGTEVGRTGQIVGCEDGSQVRHGENRVSAIVGKPVLPSIRSNRM